MTDWQGWIVQLLGAGTVGAALMKALDIWSARGRTEAEVRAQSIASEAALADAVQAQYARIVVDLHAEIVRCKTDCEAEIARLRQRIEALEQMAARRARRKASTPD